MNNPYVGVAILVASIVAAVVVYDKIPTSRSVSCNLVEFHPDLVKFREHCRAMRRAAK